MEIWELLQQLNWYGLILGVGFAVISNLLLGRFKSLQYWQVILLGIFVLIGARSVHVVTEFGYYSEVGFKNAINTSSGGLSLAGVYIGFISWLLILKISRDIKFEVMDYCVIWMPLVQAFGRVGNLINGELYFQGRPYFMLESVGNLILFAWLYFRKPQFMLQLFYEYFIGYSVIRVLTNELRPDNSNYLGANFWTKFYLITLLLCLALHYAGNSFKRS